MNSYTIYEILKATNGTLWKSMKLARQHWNSYGDKWHCYGNVQIYEILNEVHYGDSIRSTHGDTNIFSYGDSRDSYATYVPEEFLLAWH